MWKALANSVVLIFSLRSYGAENRCDRVTHIGFDVPVLTYLPENQHGVNLEVITNGPGVVHMERESPYEQTVIKKRLG